MKDIKFSIVIPTYNDSMYLLSCINSILRNDSDSLVEIIVVNDGSSDSSLEIVNNIRKLHKKIVVIDKEHTNAGDCRNIGFSKLTKHDGYVWFVDADDEISINSLARLKVLLSNLSYLPDIVEFSYSLFDEDQNTQLEPVSRDKEILSALQEGYIYSIADIPQIIRMVAYPWNKIYKIDFLVDTKINFSSTLVNNDLKFKILTEISAKSICICKGQLYEHKINKISKKQITAISDNRRLDCIKAISETNEGLACLLSNFDEYTKDKIVFNYNTFKFQFLLWAYNKIEEEYKYILEDFIKKELINLSDVDCLALMNNIFISNEDKKFYSSFINNNIIFSERNNDILVSIIVTTYNIEKYIAECLDSLVSQTNVKFNYEVIIVDDASTDNTQNIIKKYENNFGFRVFIFEKNTIGGVSSAANFGISKARGKYILFVDGDDVVESNFVSDSILTMIGSGADITIFDYGLFDHKKKYHSKDKKAFESLLVKSATICYDNKDCLKLNPVPWRKVYSRLFLEKNNIKFDVCDYFFEDNSFHWFCVCKSKSICLLDKVLIFHRIGREGQTTHGNGKKYFAFIYHANVISNFLIKEHLFDTYKIHLLRWFLGTMMWVLPRLSGYRFEFIKESKSFFSNFKKDDLDDMVKIYPCKKSTYQFHYSIMKGNLISAYLEKFIWQVILLSKKLGVIFLKMWKKILGNL